VPWSKKKETTALLGENTRPLAAGSIVFEKTFFASSSSFQRWC
jgi:hypothetical protein